MNTYNNTYIKLFNKIKSNEHLHYIVITHINGLKSKEQLMYLTKKSNRDTTNV